MECAVFMPASEHHIIFLCAKHDQKIIYVCFYSYNFTEHQVYELIQFMHSFLSFLTGIVKIRMLTFH